MLFRCVPVPCGRFSHISLICQFFFQYGTLVRLRWNSAFANAHRNVYNNCGLARSDQIMGGLWQEDVEVFLHVTMVAITLTGIFTTIP